MLSPAHGDAECAPPDLMQRVPFHVSTDIAEDEDGRGDAIPFYVGIDREEKDKNCDATK